MGDFGAFFVGSQNQTALFPGPVCPAARPVVVEVENVGTTRGSLLLINWPPEILALAIKPALDFDPYMSGGMTLRAPRPSSRSHRHPFGCTGSTISAS